MSDSRRPCPICRDATAEVLVPVAVRRAGRIVARIEIPAARCATCGHVDVADAAQEAAIDELERHSQPGDDLVFPLDD